MVNLQNIITPSPINLHCAMRERVQFSELAKISLYHNFSDCVPLIMIGMDASLLSV